MRLANLLSKYTIQVILAVIIMLDVKTISNPGGILNEGANYLAPSSSELLSKFDENNNNSIEPRRVVKEQNFSDRNGTRVSIRKRKVGETSLNQPETRNLSLAFKTVAASVADSPIVISQSQCQARFSSPLSSSGSFFSPSSLSSSSIIKRQRKVYVNQTTMKRSFDSRIVALFSCSDSVDQWTNNDLRLDFRLAKPAIELAVAEVRHKYTNINFNVTYRSAPDICKNQQAAGYAADEYYENGANYFIGPGCSDPLESVGRLASYWNVPICSTGYLPEVISSSFSPLTLIQISLSVQSIGEMLLMLFHQYRWRHMVIVTDERHPLHTAMRDGLLEFFHTLYATRRKSLSAASNHQQYQYQQFFPASGTVSLPFNHSAKSFGQSFDEQPAKPANSRYWQNQNYPNDLNQDSAEHSEQEDRSSADTLGGAGRRSGQTRRGPIYHFINITTKSFAFSKTEQVDYEQIMLDAASHSRIMLLLTKSSTIFNLLEAAYNQGMSKGQFVFLALEVFEIQRFEASVGGGSSNVLDLGGAVIGSPLSAPNPGQSHPFRQQQQHQQQQQQQSSSLPSSLPKSTFLSASNNSQSDALNSHAFGNASNQLVTDQYIKEIFQPLMTISFKIPVTAKFDTFRKDVASLSEQEFNYRIQLSSLQSLYSLSVAAFIYDCIILYADKVNFILESTQFSLIDGKTLFKLLAGDVEAIPNALTGNLTINEAGQRVVDLTLNDFSQKTLSLEPIAHFMAFDKELSFLPGKLPHWAAQNQSVPNSDPRCRVEDIFCRFSDEELNFATLNGSNSFVVGVWLIFTIIGTIALSSSLIGFLIYRKFRIESELLNLWWSIKYEDIIFEDEILCDGKRSMSSLAVSTESFNDRSPVASQNTAPSAIGIACNQNDATCLPTPALATTTTTCLPHQDSLSANLAVSTITSGVPTTTMAATYSTSSLSVAGLSSPSGASGAVLAPTQSATSLTAGGNRSQKVSNRTDQAAGTVQVATTKQSSANQLLGHQSAGQKSSKLLQVSSSGKSSSGGLRGAQSGSGKMGAFGIGIGIGKASSNRSATGLHPKDPSISSQNKAKLKLGTVLNGCASDSAYPTKVGLYKASRVAVKHLNVKNLNINRQLLIELRQVRDLTHENLIKFIGLCPDEPNVAIVSELCTRGNLQDLLQNESIRLDWPFRYSIINDIVDGLLHLQSSPIQFHGRLKSSNCVIDNRFVVKLTNFGLPSLMSAVEIDDNVNSRLLLWTAPEHLRMKHPLCSGSQKGDVYSLAIIFQEIITRCGPFECEPILCNQPATVIDDYTSRAGAAASNLRVGSNYVQQVIAPLAPPVLVQHRQRLEPAEIVNLVRMGLSPPFRPYFRPDIAIGQQQLGNLTGSTGQQQQQQQQQQQNDFNVGELIKIVQNCWQENPVARPTVASVKQQIKKMRRGQLDSSNLMDNLLQRMERYTDNLESLVQQKTAELMEEKKRSEELLYEMLPRFVVDQLKYGHSVTPEAYEAVTVCFSDIKDFTSIAAQSSPIEVVNLLNQLYTEFDDCIARYDVYKVETIGDAYMVVSGLPVRNGDSHAKEIAEMSLSMLELIRNFEIVHLPQVTLQLRIGVHSGPCASGVVGTKMFRYCLFGDTVNTASRMESHGEPMKIHISAETASILEKFNSFIIEPRGEIDIKGKGPMRTFWLLGEK